MNIIIEMIIFVGMIWKYFLNSWHQMESWFFFTKNLLFLQLIVVSGPKKQFKEYTNGSFPVPLKKHHFKRQHRTTLFYYKLSVRKAENFAQDIAQFKVS